jgi:hypothetical protein
MRPVTSRYHRRQERAATASLFIDLGFGGGPMALGLIAGSAGIPTAFAAAAVLAAVGAGGCALLAVCGGRTRDPGCVRRVDLAMSDS